MSKLIIKCVIVTACFQSVAGAERQFKFKDGTIYDGNEKIAVFDVKTMTFSQVKLKPGGKVIIDKWSIYWSRGKTYRTLPAEKLSVDNSSPSRLKMNIVAYSKGRYHRSESVVCLSYDEKLKSYVYEVNGEFRTNRYHGEWNLMHPMRDFARIVFSEGNAPYEHYVYQSRSDDWIKVPLNYVLAPDKFDICLKRGTTVTALFNPTENVSPVIEVSELTPQNDCAACVLTWPALTVHLRRARHVIRPWGKRREPAHYRIYCYDKRHVEDIVRSAKGRIYSNEELNEYDRPKFETGGVNDFEKAVGLDKPERRAFWTFTGDIGATCWCRKVGYKSQSSLKCGDVDKVVNCCWEIAPPDKEPVFKPGQAYVVSTYVKTEKLEGEGAYISCTAGKENKAIISEKITGSSDWRRIEIRIPLSKTPGAVQIRLHHKGKGVSYFDCVKIEPRSPA